MPLQRHPPRPQGGDGGQGGKLKYTFLVFNVFNVCKLKVKVNHFQKRTKNLNVKHHVQFEV